MQTPVESAAAAVEAVYRADWGRIVAVLIGLFRDFDLAEECAAEAFAIAAGHWADSGVPDNPRAWVIQTARHKAIDRVRAEQLHRTKLASYATSFRGAEYEIPDYDTDEIPDDRLRLIFTCCHPALGADAQVALTLRTLCGLETDEIARAFLVPTATMAQRLVRAKRKIRDAGIPYSVPAASELAARVDAVLTAIYLVFNEGYSATRGESLIRTGLCTEAVRLARLVLTLTGPKPPAEAQGLLALMLLHDARKDARQDQAGEIVVLEEQDRARWNQTLIAEALPLVAESLRDAPGPFALQAAIVAEHCIAARAEDTNWRRILRLYDVLAEVAASPVVALNRAVAVAMVDGPAAALPLIDELAAAEHLENYHLLHAARADFLRRMGLAEEARQSYEKALALATNQSERRFLMKRLRELS